MIRTRLTMVALALGAAAASSVAPQAQGSPQRALRAAEDTEAAKGCPAAIEQYEKVSSVSDRAVAAMALARLGACYEKVGDGAEASKVFERIEATYADQTEIVATARQRLGRTEKPPAGTASRTIWALDYNPLASLSPDGRFLSYSDRQDVFLREIANGTTRKLTNRPKDSQDRVYETFMSPDGTRVAYNWYVQPERRYTVRLANVAGNDNPRVLYDINADSYDLFIHDWSPDSKALAVSIQRKDNTVQIGLLSASDGSLKVLRTLNWRSIETMKFSPDGRYLGYSRAPDDTPNQPRLDVFVLAVSGSTELPAVTGAEDDRMAGWSPDGRWLLFTRERSEFTDLWAIAFAAGRPQGMPQRVRLNVGPRFRLVGWSRSGALHYYTASSDGQRMDVQVASVDLAAGRLRALPTDAESERENTRSPRFSADGKQLAYLSERRGREREEGTALVIRDMETGRVMREIRPRQLRRIAGIAAWSPDARSVFVTASDITSEQQPLGDGIYRIDVQTGEASTVLRYDHDRLPLTTGFAWMPDGLSFLTSGPGTNNVGSIQYRVDVRTGTLTALGIEENNASSRAGSVIPSVDGKSAYYRLNVRRASGRGGQTVAIIKRDLETGKDLELLRQTPLGEHLVSPDGRYLAVPSTEPASGSRVVLLLPIAGGDARTIMRIPMAGYDLAVRGWAPDSSVLLVGAWPTNQAGATAGALELWLVYVDGRDPKKLEGGTLPSDYPVTLSPDGRHLVYTSVGPFPPIVSEVAVLENFLPKTARQ